MGLQPIKTESAFLFCHSDRSGGISYYFSASFARKYL